MKEKKEISRQALQKTGASIFNISYGVLKQLIFISFISALLIGITAIGVGLGYFANIISKTDIPTYESMQVSLGNLNQTSSIYYNNGDMISEIQSDLQRQLVKSEDISEYIKLGVIATEDNYFYHHQGFVPKAVIRATLQELVGSSTQTGGSTLTQQLVKQQLLTNEFTFTRKAKEILLAMRIEKYFTKDQILTAYLNVSPFGRNSNGENIAGIETAAQGIFGKSAKDVTLPQAAYLAGLPQLPYSYTPYTNLGTRKKDLSLGIERMHIVLNAMRRQNYISQEEYDAAMAYDITQDFIGPTEHKQNTQSYLYQAIHREAVIVLMKQQVQKDGRTWEEVNQSVELYNDYYYQMSNKLSASGYKVHSTIDKDVYHAMQATVPNNATILGQTYQTEYTDPTTGQKSIVYEPVQMGSIVIENATGRVLGFIGGTNFSITQSDHAFVTRRSPGSTIKPLLVYAPAIENNLITPSTLLADTEINRLQSNGTYWSPKNANGTVSGNFLSAREALKQSLNNPTIHLYSHMLNQRIDTGKYMQAMGVKGIPLIEYFNEAASVGGFSSGPTVAEQTSAFTTFANNGVHINYYLIEKIEDQEGNVIYQHQSVKTPVFSESTAFMMRSMLSDSVNSGTTQYFKQFLNFSFPVTYGKTGTSDSYEDMWAIISTPQITIGQWAGWDNSYGIKHLFVLDNGHGNVSVRTQRVWANVANAINSVKPSLFNTNQAFSPQPANVFTQTVLDTTGTLPGEITLPNGQKVNVTGNNITDFFTSTNPPRPASFNFSPGASLSDLEKFWSKYAKPEESSTESSSNSENSSNEEEEEDGD